MVLFHSPDNNQNCGRKRSDVCKSHDKQPAVAEEDII